MEGQVDFYQAVSARPEFWAGSSSAWDDEASYVTYNPVAGRITCTGPMAAAIRTLMPDRRARPISQSTNVQTFFDTLPYRLRNHTVANPVLYERISDQEVTTP